MINGLKCLLAQRDIVKLFEIWPAMMSDLLDVAGMMVI